MIMWLRRWLYPELEQAENGSQETRRTLEDILSALSRDDEEELLRLQKTLERRKGVDR